MTTLQPFAFVLMPISQDFTDIYYAGIREECRALKITAERVDEQQFDETILARIYRQIEQSDFIIADMTGRNANVFYEVGYAHAKNKRCALITQDASDIPFDLKHHQHVIYDGSITDLRQKLKPKLAWMKEETSRAKQQTITLKHSVKGAILEKSQYRHDGKVSLLLHLVNETSRRSPEIEAIYVTVKRSWKLSSGGKACPSSNIKGRPEVKRFLVAPTLKRLAPSAFSEEQVDFVGEFWSKWGGQEEKDGYAISGNVEVEIVTSEGTFSNAIPLNVTFDEIPF